MRSIKRRRLKKAGTALIMFVAVAIKIYAAADAAGVMKERLAF